MTLAAESLRFAWERGTSPAVEGVSFELGQGELLVLVGPNGSGKSTLMALLAGWLRPQSGRVLLEGRPLGEVRPRDRARRLAYLPQQVAPLYDLTVAELVATGRYPWRSGVPTPSTADPAVDRAIVAADLEGLAGRSFHSLSGGERQRALIASVLAQETRWMLLDEPTASLDLHHAVGVFRVLEEAAERGSGVLAVTHDLNLAALFADRVGLVRDGRLAGLGTPEEVLTPDVLQAAYGPEVLVEGRSDSERPAVLPRRGGTP